MTESIRAAAQPPSLFRQIANRLALLTVSFALLNVAIVVPLYAFNPQALAEDLIDQQAQRIDRAIGGSLVAGAAMPRPLELSQPLGVSDWGFTVIDRNLRSAFRGGKSQMHGLTEWPLHSTLSWTRRNTEPNGTLVSGARRFETKAGPYWILVEAKVVDGATYLPVIGQELLEHVALPLVPLMVLLLIFSVQVVRRTLAPLEAAEKEVNALDPSRMEARLTVPQTSREVAILVSAVNRALDKLQGAMVLLKTFTADAAHELRTPLSVLQLQINALPEGPCKSRLCEDVQAMTRLINQMLDLAQADALRLDHAVEIQPHDLATTVVTQIAPLAFSLGRDIKLVDHGGSPILGLTDALGRALRNLIENAIHHAPSGRLIEVIVGPGPRFSVRDHGAGLPEGESEKLFDRFWRKSRTTSVGSGLGLGIVRSIVEAHGGTVAAQNAPGGGALFVCEFPTSAYAFQSHLAVAQRPAEPMFSKIETS